MKHVHRITVWISVATKWPSDKPGAAQPHQKPIRLIHLAEAKERVNITPQCIHPKQVDVVTFVCWHFRISLRNVMFYINSGQSFKDGKPRGCVGTLPTSHIGYHLESITSPVLNSISNLFLSSSEPLGAYSEIPALHGSGDVKWKDSMLIASTDFAVFYWRSLRGSEVANYRTCKEPQNDSGFVRQKENKTTSTTW